MGVFEREQTPSEMVTEALQRTRPKCRWCGENASDQIIYGGFRWKHEQFACAAHAVEMAAQMHADDMRITEIIDIRAAWGDEV